MCCSSGDTLADRHVDIVQSCVISQPDQSSFLPRSYVVGGIDFIHIIGDRN